MNKHMIIVFYSQIENEKYILEYKESDYNNLKYYSSQSNIDITLHSLVDNDSTIETILKTNPYFTNAKRLSNFDELKKKLEKIISLKSPSLFDTFIGSMS